MPTFPRGRLVPNEFLLLHKLMRSYIYNLLQRSASADFRPASDIFLETFADFLENVVSFVDVFHISNIMELSIHGV